MWRARGGFWATGLGWCVLGKDQRGGKAAALTCSAEMPGPGLSSVLRSRRGSAGGALAVLEGSVL